MKNLMKVQEQHYMSRYLTINNKTKLIIIINTIEQTYNQQTI